MTKAEISKDNYNFYKRNGICVQCCTYKSAPGRVRCEVCLAQNSESQKIRLDKETKEQEELRKKKHREYLKNLREERKEKGLCIHCGKPQSRLSTVFCVEHMLKNQKNNKRSTEIQRAERKEYGLCYVCGKESMFGKNVCEKHYSMCCENLPKANANAFWKQDNNFVFRKVGAL